MRSARIGAIALTGALLAGGGGAAIAAITKDDAKKAEQSVLDSAAKRLNVTPQALRDALAASQDEQLDTAVKDGLLTQAQADAIKARRKRSGTVLGGPFGGGPGHHMFGPGGPRHHKGGGHALFDDAAKALGLTTPKLFEQLRDGKSFADIAKAQGKSLDDVRAAVKAAAKTRADKAVADGDITRAQADEKLARLDEILTKLETAKLHERRRFRGGPPRHGNRPGSFAPAPQAGAIFS